MVLWHWKISRERESLGKKNASENESKFRFSDPQHPLTLELLCCAIDWGWILRDEPNCESGSIEMEYREDF